MTVIEFFSADPIENVASLVALRPERVIVLGDANAMKEQKSCYENFVNDLDWRVVLQFLSKEDTELSPVERLSKEQNAVEGDLGSATLMQFLPWDAQDFDVALQTLTELITSLDDVRVDLTGGNETAILAMGHITERLSATHTVTMHRFDLKEGAAYSVPSKEKLSLAYRLEVSVKQLVELHGGKVGGAANGSPLRKWMLTPSLCREIDGVWEACREAPSSWNGWIKDLCFLNKHRDRTAAPLELKINMSGNTSPSNKVTESVEALFKKLDEKGVGTHCGKLHFRYASKAVKHCVSKEGNALEMHTLLAAMRMVFKDGGKFFDAKSSVYMDWNGRFGEPDNVHNEVDVMIMWGVCPIFVSCKNGEVPADELFKLRAVTDRFGGNRSTAVLIADKKELTPAFIERASQMKIHLIDDVYKVSWRTLASKLRELCRK